jgi:acetoacetyl-CoA synthetase
VDVRATPADNPLWFESARLNWAQNQLDKWKDSTRVALIQARQSYFNNFYPDTNLVGVVEPNSLNPNPEYRRLSYNELYESTIKAARALESLGVKAGDRVGSYCSNSIVRTPFTFLVQSPLLSLPPLFSLLRTFPNPFCHLS